MCKLITNNPPLPLLIILLLVFRLHYATHFKDSSGVVRACHDIFKHGGLTTPQLDHYDADWDPPHYFSLLQKISASSAIHASFRQDLELAMQQVY